MKPQEYFQVVTPQRAREILSRFAFREGEEISTLNALDRFLLKDIYSPEDIPPYSRSTVDGYAVRSKDTIGASASQPSYLKLAGSIEMGQVPGQSLGPEEAFQIHTGGMLPQGADAVVMFEQVRLQDKNIELSRPLSPWENVMKAGEDYLKGDLIAKKGQKLRPQDIGAIAGAGISVIPVLKRPIVGLISTGDEIVPLGQKPSEGQIRSINHYALGTGITQAGAILEDLGHIPDSLNSFKEKVRIALNCCDYIIISGGSSVGTRDLTLKALESFYPCKLLFHGIAASPGKPTLAAVIGSSRLVLGLPGHPASAYIVFIAFIRPLLQGHKEIEWFPSVRAVLDRDVSSTPGREEYVRVILEEKHDGHHAIPVLGKSGGIKTLASANGLIRIGMEKEGLEKGELVDVLLF